ncbi:MAG: uroporphyrinogen-III synthase [Hydrogenophilaceae bacterium]|nr:uroporphyrinogen-III synthase [Hydrogenophilaceae bacterium]
MAPLAGKGILVTRPREQAARLSQRLQAIGARPIVFPTIEIAPPADPTRLHAVVDRLGECDWAIFISPTAVAAAWPVVQSRLAAWPATLQVAAVGPASAQALRQQGIAAVHAPEQGADSEALLALPELQQVQGQHIVIFRGEGGRELLAETLRARGARVEYAECYRRRRPSVDPAAILAAWRRGEIDAVTVTSSEGMQNLFALLGEPGRAALCATPLFAPHERIAAAARALGVKRVVVTAPGDEGLLTTLNEWFAHEQPQP